MMTWIISIGNELLIGKVINTNATWLAKKLTLLGYTVRRIVTIPDEDNEIINIYRDAYENADTIISTGGLGPTFDDKTSECLAKAFDKKWIINREAYDEVKKKFDEANMKLTPTRIKMAKMPEGAKSLYNPVGIAPGIFLEVNSKVIVALPGVPKEMEAIFENSLEEILRRKGPHKYYVENSVKVVGIPESTAAEYIEKIMEKYSNRIYIKSHPRGHETRGPMLELHISTYTRSKEEGEKIISKALKELIELLEENGAIIT